MCVLQVGILSVDTEGYDALVLQGALDTLERHAVQVLEIEAHTHTTATLSSPTLTLTIRYHQSNHLPPRDPHPQPAPRVQVVEFEYHNLKPWPSHELHEVIGWLSQRQYACFWQSNIGSLAPVLRGCSYPHWWSNLVCVYKGVPSLEAAMWKLVPRTPDEFVAAHLGLVRAAARPGAASWCSARACPRADAARSLSTVVARVACTGHAARPTPHARQRS